jgi:predicted ester cyclase
LQHTVLEKNKKLIESFVEEVFSQRNLAAIDKYLATNLADASGKTPESLEKTLISLFLGFPDLHVNIEHMLAEDNRVLVFLNFDGTHQGEYEGMAPTNKPVKIRSADLYRIENNKIIEHWDVVDRLDLLKQIGAITFNKKSTEE